ncbi:MAG TPA: hypothetical protein VGM76_08730 [Lacipirellulaceae bacterium]
MSDYDFPFIETRWEASQMAAVRNNYILGRKAWIAQSPKILASRSTAC